MPLLDPKLDVVFKLLFASPANEGLLISLISSVLRPPSPISGVTVLDPEITKEQVDDRGVVLDVLVRLADGTRINLEMQCDPRGAIGQRWLYNWAWLFAKGIKRGGSYLELAPVVCIVFLDASPRGRFHDVYRVLEEHDHSLLADHFGLHVIELPRLEEHSAEEDDRLVRWARFLRARSERELHSLAREDPLMAQAKEALELLSREPSAEALAESRLKGQVYLQLELGAARAEGEAIGRAAGEASGEVTALREGIGAVVDLLALELSDAQRNELANGDRAKLRAILAHLRDTRSWPA